MDSQDLVSYKDYTPDRVYDPTLQIAIFEVKVTRECKLPSKLFLSLKEAKGYASTVVAEGYRYYNEGADIVKHRIQKRDVKYISWFNDQLEAEKQTDIEELAVDYRALWDWDKLQEVSRYEAARRKVMDVAFRSFFI